MRNQLIFTDKAKCVDCYKCLRNCPVKAISIIDGQASVVDELCITCGTCINVCPQGAKHFRDDLFLAKQLIKEYRGRIAFSIAPSFVALFNKRERMKFITALKKLGGNFISETTVGADIISEKTREILRNKKKYSLISSACPVVLNYILKYKQEKAENILPLLSPMLSHAIHLKKKLGSDWKVIFVGPCVAKKGEIEKFEVKNSVDVVLTFDEIFKWFDDEGIVLSDLEDGTFDEVSSKDIALYPISGGAFKKLGVEENHNFLLASGESEIFELLNKDEENESLFVEALFCDGGCINSFLMQKYGNFFERKRRVFEYAEDKKVEEIEYFVGNLYKKYKPFPMKEKVFSEEEIRTVLEYTGKTEREAELNCGACGYDSCREKAIAVLKGLAVPEMCMPYMKRLAESYNDKIMQTTPNGIAIVDEELKILSINDAFKRMFKCGESILGKRISYLMEPDSFEKLVSGSEKKIIDEVIYLAGYNIYCKRIIYSLDEFKRYVAIFIDITELKKGREELEKMKTDSILRAKELLEHQLSIAENVTKFLGESIAKTEKLVEDIIESN